MKAVCFHEFGTPDVLRVEDVPEPHAGPGQIRIRVHACGLNPADWVLCAGTVFGGNLPQGIGLDVSGVVDELGEGVRDVAIGDPVFGPAVFGTPTAGAAEVAVMSAWARVPDGLDLLTAGGLTMAAETAWRGLDELGVARDDTVLINGAGSVVGWVAVQLALHRGARVLATAGPARADALREAGALVTGYGDGMAGRVKELAGGNVDLAFDISPTGGALPDLVALTGDPARVLTVTDFAAAPSLGIRTSGREGTVIRYDILPEVARLAAAGVITIPIAHTYPIDQIHEAAHRSLTGHPGGKLLLLLSANDREQQS